MHQNQLTPPSYSDPLFHRRMEAALASGGTSSGPIHAAAFREFKKYKISGNLLEFGAGTGELLLTLASDDYAGSLTGTDILPRPPHLPSQISWIEADLNKQLPLPDASFDAIISTEVIEHLENPREVIRGFWRMLKPSGRVILTTPNQESLRSLLSLIISGHYVAFQDSCYPAHITALLRCDLTRIFTEAGFENVHFSFTDHGSIPKFPHRTFQEISFGVLRGRWFSDNLVLIANKPPLARLS